MCLFFKKILLHLLQFRVFSIVVNLYQDISFFLFCSLFILLNVKGCTPSADLRHVEEDIISPNNLVFAAIKG